MPEIFFAYTSIDELRDEYLYLEDDVVYEDDTCVIGCSRSRFAKDETTIVAMFGEIFNIDEFGYDIKKYTDAEIVLKLLEFEDPEDLCSSFTGCFTILVYERDFKTWILITDSMGTYYPFYYTDKDEFIISMDINDFNNTLFEFNARGMDTIINNDGFQMTETPVDGVYKLAEGSILSWPNNKIIQYIDIHEELEHAYNNKIDITVEEAIDHIDDMLRKTVNITSRHYDKSRIGVELTGDLDSMVTASTLNACGIEMPLGYSTIFPVQEQLPNVSEKKAKSETKKRRQKFDNLINKFELIEKNSAKIFDSYKIDRHLTPDAVKNPLGASQWGEVLFHNNAIGKMAYTDDISCIYNGDMGHIIFLNQLQYYIFYILSKTEVDELSEHSFRWRFHGILNNSTNYIFEDIESFEKEISMRNDGFVNYIMMIMDKFKRQASERDSRIAWGIPRIGIYKNLNLWKFILSLPDDIIISTSIDGILQKGVIEKQRDVDDIDWPFRRWKTLNPHKSSVFDEKKNKTPQSIKTVIYHTEKTKEDWDSAIELLLEKRVNFDTLWFYRQDQKENPEILDERSFKILLVYYWLKEWLN